MKPSSENKIKAIYVGQKDGTVKKVKAIYVVQEDGTVKKCVPVKLEERVSK